MHAGDDTAVPPENSIGLYQALKTAGIPTALLVIAIGWFLVQLLRRAGDELGDRMVERRLAINQAVTILRFIIYIGSFALAVLFVFSLTKEMMIALGGTIAVTVGFALKDLTASNF